MSFMTYAEAENRSNGTAIGDSRATGSEQDRQSKSWSKTGTQAPHWMTLLGTSEQGGRSYRPRVEGKVPNQLIGSLYRNGPGLFERGNRKIQHLLDGDGLVQRLSFNEGKVQYRNAFVQTDKFVAEEQSGRPEYATWTTRKSANPLANLGGGVTHSQAGVTVYPVDGRLVARDELGPSYLLDPKTLETLGHEPVGTGLNNVGVKAHSKFDPVTGEWVLAGTKFGRQMSIHVVTKTPKESRQFSFDVPRQVYIHDFLISKNYLVFILHPCFISPFSFLSGLKSFTRGFQWKPSEGNLLVVIPRAGGVAQYFESDAAFMWHALNAFEAGNELIADYVGYDDPDHFIGDDALMWNIMEGRLGHASCPGKIRRVRLNLETGSAIDEIIDHENHEFPMIDHRATMTDHRAGYFAWSGLGAFNSGLKKFDYRTGNTAVFEFGEDVQVGEPVFVQKPNGKLDQGWLISQCLDAKTKVTFFALFDAAALSDGPLAKIWLEHHVPISFHGSWQEEV